MYVGGGGGVLKKKMRWGGEVEGVRRLAFVRGGGRASLNDDLKKRNGRLNKWSGSKQELGAPSKGSIHL